MLLTWMCWCNCETTAVYSVALSSLWGLHMCQVTCLYVTVITLNYPTCFTLMYTAMSAASWRRSAHCSVDADDETWADQCRMMQIPMNYSQEKNVCLGYLMCTFIAHNYSPLNFHRYDRMIWVGKVHATCWHKSTGGITYHNEYTYICRYG